MISHADPPSTRSPSSAVSVILKACDGAPGSELPMATTPFQEFLTELFDQGKIVFRAAPRDRPSPAGVAVLAEAFETYQPGRGRSAHRV